MTRRPTRSTRTDTRVPDTTLFRSLPARRLLPAVLGKVTADDLTKREGKSTLRKSLKALSELAKFSPYVAGDTLTLADIYLRYCQTMTKWVGSSQFDWNVTEDVPGLAEWDAMMASSDQIGRASCRERGCTSVYVSVVADTLNINKKKNK